MKSFIGCLAILVLFAGLTGCATVNQQKVMSSEKQIDTLPWKNYEATESAFKKIEKERTTIEGLKSLGFDPNAKGVTILDPFTIRDILLGSNSSFKMENLPQELQEYLKDLNDCEGFKFEGKFSATNPKGDLIRRWFKFKKIDVDSTWGYEGWVFIKKSSGIVIYTRWIGYKPSDKERTRKNPLGPFQDLGDLLIGIGKKAID